MIENIDAEEVAKFNHQADQWWNPEGEFKTLHRINPLRLDYVIKQTGSLKNKSVLDVGCGGGILAESLATAGAKVTAIDMAEASLQAARDHAQAQSLNINYQLLTVEKLAAQSTQKFDVITCMELLEHVPDPGGVISACATLCKPGGHIVFSSINRTLKAFALAIVGAEYLLKLLPSSTHHYDKFVRPSELAAWARDAGLEISHITGIRYNPLNHHASLIEDVSVNYFMHCRK